SRRPKLFSSYRRGVMMGEADNDALGAQRLMMLSMDPPEHDRFKLLVSRGFGKASAAGMADRIAELARDIVDDVAGRGECDLVQAEVDGDRLTDGEFQWFFLLLVNAGGDTTRNLLASGIQLLFDHPDQRARLQADLDGVLPTATEEMLRYTSPVVHFRRTATE